MKKLNTWRNVWKVCQCLLLVVGVVLGVWSVVGFGLVVVVLVGLGLAVVGVGCLVWLVLWWL